MKADRILRRSLYSVVFALCGVVAVSAGGCSQQGQSQSDMSANVGDGMSNSDDGGTVIPPGPGDHHVSDAVLATLTNLASSTRGRTWNPTNENSLADDWLIQSPASSWGQLYAQLPVPTACSGAGCNADFGLRACTTQADCTLGGTCTEVAATMTTPGATPGKLCVGHSDSVYDQMYKVMVSAQRYVDVTSLLPPDGRFLSAMRNAVTYLSRTNQSVQVRFIFGNYPVQGAVDTRAVLDALTRDLQSGSAIKVSVGTYRSSNVPPSWNHSKIIAADGKAVIFGGHNLWDQHYLGKNPVHDISMRLRGPGAVDAHAFANEQWKYTCDNQSLTYCTTGSVCSNTWSGGNVATRQCLPMVPLASLTPDKPGDVRAVAIGRLARIDPANMSNQADTAFLTMLGAAKSTIRMAQQDLGPLKLGGVATGSWPDALWAQLGSAIVRGVEVYIVLSNKDSVAGGLTATDASYSNGWTLDEVGVNLRTYIEKNPPPGAPTGAALRDLICRKIHLAPFSFSTEDTFPGGVPLPLHAKFVMIDDQAFYIGSQNQYDAGLTEFGYLIDDARPAAIVVSSYWNKMWGQSVRKAISGSDAPACNLR